MGGLYSAVYVQVGGWLWVVIIIISISLSVFVYRKTVLTEKSRGISILLYN